MSDNLNIFYDLQKQRVTGKIYSKFFLYPRLRKLLNGHLIDYGAGIGNFSIYYRKFFKVTPLENNLDCINYMKNLGLNPLLLKNNRIPAEDNSFDSALIDNVLEHVLDVSAVMTEIKRAVKKNGTIVIGVPGVLGFNRHWDHKYFFDEIEINKLCKNFNFVLEKFIYAPLFKSEFLTLNLRQYCIYAKILNKK
jgi:2-polyprenyl-3-methyl-5-hydroxy-6-metoxy-1,4-benzoquinol methylase